MTKYYRNPNELEKAYYDDMKTVGEIAKECGVSGTTVRKWMDKFGFERRERGPRDPKRLYFRTSRFGYERCVHRLRGEEDAFAVHRLAAVAWFGFDEVADSHCHHENQIPWDNREENLEVVDAEEHGRMHATQAHT